MREICLDSWMCHGYKTITWKVNATIARVTATTGRCLRHCDSSISIYCLYRKYMKPVEEILAGFLLFFIIDRASRFASAWLVETRRMDDMKTEKIRSGIETVIMLAVFLILWYRLKR